MSFRFRCSSCLVVICNNFVRDSNVSVVCVYVYVSVFDMFHRLNITSPLFNLCCPGGDEGYFTGMMLKKTRVKLLESEIVTYPTTQMMRNLLVAQVCTHSLSCVYSSSIFLWMNQV